MVLVAGAPSQPSTPVGLRGLACLARDQCRGSGWAWIFKRRNASGIQNLHRPPRVAIGALGPDLRQEPDCKRSIQAGPN